MWHLRPTLLCCCLCSTTDNRQGSDSEAWDPTLHGYLSEGAKDQAPALPTHDTAMK